jgi:tRNA 2-thiocytidine biosynthesis protein TtcA
VYVTEAEARAYAQEVTLPIIGCCCPACGDLSLKRQRMKRLIAELELEHPDVKQSMIAALGRVVPSHLLDKALHKPKGPVTEMVQPPSGAATGAVHLAFAGRPELKAAD